MVKHFHKVHAANGDTGGHPSPVDGALPHIITCTVEHDSIRLPLEHLGEERKAGEWPLAGPHPPAVLWCDAYTACASSIFSLRDKSFSVWNRSFITEGCIDSCVRSHTHRDTHHHNQCVELVIYHLMIHRLLCIITHIPPPGCQLAYSPIVQCLIRPEDLQRIAILLNPEPTSP